MYVYAHVNFIYQELQYLLLELFSDFNAVDCSKVVVAAVFVADIVAEVVAVCVFVVPCLP